MKHMLLLPAFVLGAGQILAQPVINSADYNPLSLPQRDLKYGVLDFVDPGPSGANQVWDFSSLTGLSDYPATAFPCPGSPDCSAFPEATEYIQVDTGKVYYKRTPSELVEVGILTSTGATTTYTDPYKFIQFPIAYQSTYEDSYASVTQSVPHDGFLRSEIDAYGTLTIPSGTFTDVLRQKLVDSFYMEMNGFGAKLVFTQYHWFKAHVHHPLLTIIISDVTFDEAPELPEAPTVYVAAYLNPGASGLNDLPETLGSIAIFPNPVSAGQAVTISSGEAGIRRVKLMNLLGQEIGGTDFPNPSLNIEVPMQDFKLKSGVYILSVETTKGTLSKKIIVQK